MSQWDFWIDRGGTFTDVVARDPEGKIHVRKLLSENPEQYEDAPMQAIRKFLNVDGLEDPVPDGCIHCVKMGTTVATNALLERQGAPVGLVVTQGFSDLLEIGYQNRPDIFALKIEKPEKITTYTIEVDERVLADGTVRRRPDLARLRGQLAEAYSRGIRSLAVILLHSYAFPEHERLVGEAAREIGFEHIALSHEVGREIKAVARGDTAAVDAYLTPILRNYIRRVRKALGAGVDLRFMQSHGGLAEAEHFSGKDAIFSGPAGGVVACAHVARSTGFDKVIGFDMGGTSTDVSRYYNDFERVFENVVAGVRIQAPMLNIVTVAAGGGSILRFEDGRLRVGPESAGAIPGPACYRRGGPLAVTDANAVLGRIHPGYFPTCFGPSADQPLDVEASRKAFAQVSEQIRTSDGLEMKIEEIAAGFLRIANENMVKPIREISVARGYDVREYALLCFGGAGAQHACAIAAELGIGSIILHPMAGVLSAYGMGLADVIRTDAEAVLKPFDRNTLDELRPRFKAVEKRARKDVASQGIAADKIIHLRSLDLRYEGVETYLNVPWTIDSDPNTAFERLHRQLYGFTKSGHPIEIVNLRVETRGETDKPEEPGSEVQEGDIDPSESVDNITVYFDLLEPGGIRTLRPIDTPVFKRSSLKPGSRLKGPALIVEEVSTVVVDPGWKAFVNEHGTLLLNTENDVQQCEHITTKRDPVLLELFNNLFMSVAEQMGVTLRKVSHSTNIKERLDFSCAVFEESGDLVANAPHIPVHLGAMSESVKALIDARDGTMQSGDVYMTNDPYHGGSHLPDVTVVTPVFADSGERVFFVAGRGHHADIGGITPGSMPPFSRTIEEEGILIHNFQLVKEGRFQEEEVIGLLKSGRFPARNIPERLSDLRAAIAANAAGVRLLKELIKRYGLEAVKAYMRHIKDNAEEAMRAVLSELPDGHHEFFDFLDNGSRIAVTVSIKGDSAEVDFSGTDPQLAGNLNAPRAVVASAVLYVFRTLIPRPVPLNAGCLVPIEIKIPPGTLLSPDPPAAVAGGNVETSMRITDVLYGALRKLAGSQGTMNNFAFGNEELGYYETICGGAGAGFGFDGADAVHTHMTNTRITDPEVIERRYPVVIRQFSIRKGSGGTGVWQGGDGAVREVEFLESMNATILSERRVKAPFGVNGAKSGQRGRNALVQKGEVQELPGKVSVDIEPGGAIVLETPGGGGYTPSREEWSVMRPAFARGIFRENRYTGPTAGISHGYVQANLVILPSDLADDFEEYCTRNHKPCPLLERLSPGNPLTKYLAKGADIRSDLPRYWIYSGNGEYIETFNIENRFGPESTVFLLGCSFTFEEALANVGLVPRHVELGLNVPMYRTNQETVSVGPFSGSLVVTMRPIPGNRVEEVYELTKPFERTHGAPIHHGDPTGIGIANLASPDWGDPVQIYEDEVPVFWACGVTSQEAVMSGLKSGAVKEVITHAPGHMFIGDITNSELNC